MAIDCTVVCGYPTQRLRWLYSAETLCPFLAREQTGVHFCARHCVTHPHRKLLTHAASSNAEGGVKRLPCRAGKSPAAAALSRARLAKPLHQRGSALLVSACARNLRT